LAISTLPQTYPNNGLKMVQNDLTPTPIFDDSEGWRVPSRT
jgi:hypothetical protein